MRIKPSILLCLVTLCACLFHTVQAANNSVEISGWGQSFWQSPDGVSIDTKKTGIKITTNPEYVAEGLASLHIFIDEQMDNLNIQAAQSIPELEAGKTYIVTGKFNVPSNSWRYRLMFGNETLVNIGDIVDSFGEWSDAEYIFKYDKSSTEFRIQSCGTGDLYADDISIREVIYEEDGTTVSGYGEELLTNGDFEDDLDLTPPAEISGVEVENQDKSARIKWQNPQDKDFEKVCIYDITEGIEELVYTTADTEFYVTGLENAKEYLYIIKTSDQSGNLSEGVQVIVLPVADAQKYEKPVFYINDIITQSLSPGRLKAQMLFKNNSMPEDYSAELILVILKDGAIYDIKTEYAIIPPSPEDDPYTKIEVEVNVPDEEGISAQLYIWDSITGMEAMEDFYVLN